MKSPSGDTARHGMTATRRPLTDRQLERLRAIVGAILTHRQMIGKLEEEILSECGRTTEQHGFSPGAKDGQQEQSRQV